MEKKEQFKSRLGFILVSAGCAIGIGNVWKFPYVAGANGGGVFVLFYLLFLLIMGVPILTMEFAVGRATGKSAAGAYRLLERPGQKWHLHGFVCIGACYLIMMYYTTVSGWMISYFFKFLFGEFSNIGTDAVTGIYQSLLSNPLEMIFWTSLTIILGFLVCSFGLQNGLERISKVMMIGLLLLIGVLAVNSLTLDGAAEGLKFYLLPDFEKVSDVGIWNVITAAMNQAFFTLSIGMGSMEIFGAYMSKNNTLTTEAIQICTLDTFVAIMSGLIIFPACFSFGVSPDAGPQLIFITLPRVFINMPGGRIFGALFFLFMTFASFSTVIAVFQNIIATGEETFKLGKVKNIVINCVALLILSLPAVLGYNLLSDFNIFGMNILDLEDFILSGIILPVGAIIFLLFCTTKYGWGCDNYLLECNTGRGIKMSRRLKYYFRFVLPIMILIIIIGGFI